MTRLTLYTAIFVVLAALATAQVFIEDLGLSYWVGVAAIMTLSTLKAVIVVAYYQHLRWEPRSLTYLIGIGVLAALALTVAASYSIT